MRTLGTTKYSYIQKGYKFHEWEVLSFKDGNVSSRCSCGQIKNQRVYDFIRGNSKRCKNVIHKAQDRLGKKYGHFTLVKFIRHIGFANPEYSCKCKCGKLVIKNLKQLTKKESPRHCGCDPQYKKRMGPGVAAFRAYYNLYRSRAKREGIPFKINKAQFLYTTLQPCSYCGIQLSKEFKHSKQTKVGFKCNGVDRIDNTKGYTVKNITAACHSCNRSKGSISTTMAKKISVLVPKNIKLKPVNPLIRSRIKSILYLMTFCRRKIQIDIPPERALQLMSSPCIYCNKLKPARFFNKVLKISGIDRLDSLKGYSLENSVPCCKQCNTIKKDCNLSIALAMVRLVKNNPLEKKLKNFSKIRDEFTEFQQLPFPVQQ